MHNLESLLYKQLNEYKDRDKLTMSDLEVVHKLTDTIKNIKKIEMLDGGEDYGRHYVRGHYSRDERHYDNNADYRYSRTSVLDRLEQIMHEAPENEKAIIKRAINEIR